MSTIHELILEPHQTCGCPSCEEGRFFKRVAGMLPESESKELLDWYNAHRDNREEEMMTKAWIISELQEVTDCLQKSEGEDE